MLKTLYEIEGKVILRILEFCQHYGGGLCEIGGSKAKGGVGGGLKRRETI